MAKFQFLILSFSLSFLSILLQSCNGQVRKLDPIYSQVKQYFLDSVPEILRADSIYTKIDTLSSNEKGIAQAAEYRWAFVEAKKAGNKDSVLLSIAEDSAFRMALSMDASDFLYYRSRSLLIYTMKNGRKGLGEKWLYFDKDFKPVPKYTFIKKIAITDNEKLLTRDYFPRGAEELKRFEDSGFLLQK
jgi:hypothetical protein